MNDPVDKTVIPATGNPMKSHDAGDTFIEVSGGGGNFTDTEVHLLIRSNDGDFAQGWFEASDLNTAINAHARSAGHAMSETPEQYATKLAEAINDWGGCFACCGRDDTFDEFRPDPDPYGSDDSRTGRAHERVKEAIAELVKRTREDERRQ